jgi:hypothetical protein
MSELKVNKISPRSGTDLTLGDSGDTFTIPAGASMVNNGTSTGFGPTGAVTWDTTAKTADFTAISKVGYFVDTTSGAITVTLPATPSAGDIVGLVDYAGTFDTNALEIDGNGEDIEGSAVNQLLTGEREGVVLVYVDSTQGWLPISGINEGTDALEPATYSVDFLVIAGGGGGDLLGGGGAGGYRTSTQTVTGGTVITVTVGDGGAASSNGSNSSISGSSLTTITSAGGGKGGVSNAVSPGHLGSDGGSGGGSAYPIGGSGNAYPGGAGNTPNTSPSQGNNGGGHAAASGIGSAGGGGGAGATGNANSSGNGGNGGAGTASSITGSSITRAGGGGGWGETTTGTGGAGGGGDAGVPGIAGTVNTGGGGGGSNTTAGGGGKGVVILSMPLTNFSGTVTGSPTESDDGTTKVLIFNGDGSYTT